MTRVIAVLIAAFAIGAFAVNAQDAPRPAEPPKPEGEAAPEPRAGSEPEKAEKPAPRAADAVAGSFKTAAIEDLKLTDEEAGKELGLLVVTPEGEGKFPVVVFSAAQAPATARPLATFWASHGYVIIVPAHADAMQGPGGQNPGGNRQDRGALVDRAFDLADADKDGKLSPEETPEMWKERLKDADADKDGFLTKKEVRKALGIEDTAKPAPEAPKPEKPAGPRKEEEFGMGFEPAPEPPSRQQPRGGNQQGRRGPTIATAIERVADLTLVLDSLDKLGEMNAALKGKIDKDKVVVAGIGIGAYTSGLLGGMTIDVSDDKKAQSFADKRVKALIELSPMGTGQLGLTSESFKGLKLPIMTLTGSNDRAMGRRGGGEAQGPEWRREAFTNAPEGGKIHVFIEGGSSWSFLGRTIGLRGRQPTEDQVAATRQVFSWVQASTLHFLNANLKADQAAAKLLDAEAFKKATGGKVAIENK